MPPMAANASMNAHLIYHGSDGAATRQFYAELLTRGPLGVIAVNLLRAQKCSSRAKKYRGRVQRGGPSFRDLAYDRKGWSLKQLAEALAEHGQSLGITFGWGRDETVSFNNWVLYCDLPCGQVSFHSPERYAGPDYPGKWDGVRLSEDRIINFVQEVYAQTCSNNHANAHAT
jgi:hypothetical protein